MFFENIDPACPLVWTVENVLNPAECAAMIQRIEDAGCSAAPITTARGFEMRPDIRNNSRAIIDDPALAAELFRRVEGVVPRLFRGNVASGANERFRCYRYEPGQRFAMHGDGAFVRDNRERSFLTFMVYLNEGFEGGETLFLEPKTTIVPKAGMALLFQHPLLHEGCEVTSGVKYVLRSDVMYRKAAPPLVS